MEFFLKYLLDEKFVVSLLYWQAIIIPLIALLGGTLWGYWRKNLVPYIVRGLCLGFMGPLILGMWLVYNRIVERFGLDSVANLFVNLLVFCTVGIVLGLIIRKIIFKTESMIKESAH